MGGTYVDFSLVCRLVLRPCGGREKTEFGYIPQIRCLVFLTGTNHHSIAHNGQVLPNRKAIRTQVMKQIDKATKSGNRDMSIAANAYLQYLTPRLVFLKEVLSHRKLKVLPLCRTN